MIRYVPFLALLCIAGCGRAPDSAAAKNGPPPSPAGSSGRIAFPPDSPKLARIRIAPAGIAEVPADEVVAPGKITIDANRISRIVLPLPGRVSEVAVRLGDSVSEGQPLLRIESPEAEAAMSECLRTEAALAQARATLAKAQSDFERVGDLYKHGAAARKEVVDAEAELARSQAGIKDAQAATEQARRRVSILGLKPGEFGQRVVVRAPIPGKVMEINLAQGEYRNDTSAAVLTIADLRTVWVTSHVPETSIRWIHQGERVQIELAGYPGEIFDGRVTRMSDIVDPQTRAVEVHAQLDNRAGRFRPEMFAKIRHSHGSRSLPVVPLNALVRAAGSAWVYVEREPGVFEKVRVETGEALGQMVPVLSGIEPGARVVVGGAILLQSGGAS